MGVSIGNSSASVITPRHRNALYVHTQRKKGEIAKNWLFTDLSSSLITSERVLIDCSKVGKKSTDGTCSIEQYTNGQRWREKRIGVRTRIASLSLLSTGISIGSCTQLQNDWMDIFLN